MTNASMKSGKIGIPLTIAVETTRRVFAQTAAIGARK
jgi:hypothetical protein